MLILNIQMFAVPFRKVSKTRKRTRHAHNQISAPAMVKCTNCGEMIKPHMVCPHCGTYKKEQIIEVKSKASD